MSLLEVVVAMAVFTVGVVAVLSLLINTTRVTGANIRRSTAAGLVDETLEAARSQTAAAIPSGQQVSTRTVGSITYTVTQTAGYLTSDATSNLCTSTGSTLAYKLVRVSVTWPGMGSVQPVTGDLLRAVGVGAAETTQGTFAVRIVGATGLPVSGVTVTLTGTTTSQTTGSDGCVAFTGLSAGSYSATVGQSGYVGTANTQVAKTSVMSISAGNVARASLEYDVERSLDVGFDAPVSSYVVPSGLPIRIGNSFVTESTAPTCTGSETAACITAVPGQLRHLYPESYTVKAGSCTETDASQALINLVPAQTSTPSLAVPMAAVTLTLTRASGSLTPTDRTATFSHAAATGCTSGETYTTTTVSGATTLLLPYGTWTVSVPLNSKVAAAGSVSQTVTVSSSARTASVTATVVL